ncbi:MAG: KR domain-containing protein, partial [Proteobacteria bacterium]|nr:KR domain-containing protein [Pseudomonadota bacterium]
TFCPLGELSVSGLEADLAGKVGGAWHLHERLSEHSLDAFVLFGSIAGLWGSGGQAGYSAANAGLTALAHHRRGCGLPATVLHWGAWADERGMADAEAMRQLRRRGVLPVAPEGFLPALDLVHERVSLGVVDIDWARFVPAFTLQRPRPLLQGVPEARAVLDEAPATAGRVAVALRESLRALSDEQALARVRGLVLAQTSATLGHQTGDALGLDVGFQELGLDSLMAVELRNRLQQQLGLSVPATVAFDHPTVARLSEWALAELRGQTSAEVDVELLASDEPVAIVGAGLRMPGGATDLDSLWRVLSEGVDTLRELSERFDFADRYDPDPEAVGCSYVRHASLLDDVAGFDASFFGISPREAGPMDPQHRLLLETAWEALEVAGICPSTLRDTATGVFVGVNGNEYSQ